MANSDVADEIIDRFVCARDNAHGRCVAWTIDYRRVDDQCLRIPSVKIGNRCFCWQHAKMVRKALERAGIATKDVPAPEPKRFKVNVVGRLG